MIELKITGEKEKECECYMEGLAPDLAAEAILAFEKILEPLPDPLKKAVLMCATTEVKNKIEK